ncbi:MAG: hypothetical protein KatS3mg010_1638 [Acidimicrobiia bacterium]|nr:MAG: hypothetical protein KatS3mg010_1638 [Acidimicrobiia bacterium]
MPRECSAGGPSPGSSPRATRSPPWPERRRRRRRSPRLGARPVEVSIFDPDALRHAVAGHDAVCNLATHIPPVREASRPDAWAENSRIRAEGSRNLVGAAVAAGAQVYVQESIAFVYGEHGNRVIDADSTPLGDTPVHGGRPRGRVAGHAVRRTGWSGSGAALRHVLGARREPHRFDRRDGPARPQRPLRARRRVPADGRRRRRGRCRRARPRRAFRHLRRRGRPRAAPGGRRRARARGRSPAPAAAVPDGDVATQGAALHVVAARVRPTLHGGDRMAAGEPHGGRRRHPGRRRVGRRAVAPPAPPASGCGRSR